MELTVTWSDIEKELSAYTLPNEYNETVLFGAGFLGETEAPLLKNGLNIVAFSDNDPAKWKKEIAGIPCVAPENLRNIRMYLCWSRLSSIILRLQSRCRNLAYLIAR